MNPDLSDQCQESVDVLRSVSIFEMSEPVSTQYEGAHNSVDFLVVVNSADQVWPVVNLKCNAKYTSVRAELNAALMSAADMFGRVASVRRKVNSPPSAIAPNNSTLSGNAKPKAMRPTVLNRATIAPYSSCSIA